MKVLSGSQTQKSQYMSVCEILVAAETGVRRGRADASLTPSVC